MAELPVPPLAGTSQTNSAVSPREDARILDAYFDRYKTRFVEEMECKSSQAEESRKEQRQLFSVNELKREAEFEAQQIHRSATSEDRENRQLQSFRVDQIEREQRFHEYEAARNETFLEKSKERSQKFLTFLDQWGKGSREKHRRAQTKAHDEHEKRMKKLGKTVLQVRGDFLNMIATWEDRVQRDEIEREQTFRRAHQTRVRENEGPGN